MRMLSVIIRAILWRILPALCIAIPLLLSPGSDATAQIYNCAGLEEATPQPTENRTLKVTRNLVLTNGRYLATLYVCADGITIDGGGATMHDLLSIIVEGHRNVTIRNVQFDNASILISGSSNCLVTNCTMNGGTNLITVADGAHHNTIRDNIINAVGTGIILGDQRNPPHDNVIERNTIDVSLPHYVGIDISFTSRRNVIRDNVLTCSAGINAGYTIGISLAATENIVTENKISGFAHGIWSTGDSNMILRNDLRGAVVGTGGGSAGMAGIRISRNYNLVRSNVVRDVHAPGISLDAIVGDPPRATVVLRNTVQRCDVGIYENASAGDANAIYNNNILDNITQGNGGGGIDHYWDHDVACGGNYWSDYDTPVNGCTDTNGDGICDSMRTSPGGGTPFDRYPFTARDGWLTRLDRECTTTSDYDIVAWDLRPIQVIENVPMIMDKATMVRLFLKLVGRDRLENILVRLEGDFGTIEQRVTLINRDDETFVATPDKVELLESLLGLANSNLAHQFGFDACNFLGPYAPYAVGELHLSATVDPDNEARELLESNNRVECSVPVKSFFKGRSSLGRSYPFVIELRPAINILGSSHHGSISDLRRTAETWTNFLKATYPVPEVRTIFTASRITSANINPFGLQEIPFSLVLGLGLFNHYFFSVDHTVYIMPEGSMSGIRSLVGLTNPWSDGTLLEEGGKQHALAHEVGHARGLSHDFDDTHPMGGVAANGWDVLNLTGNMAVPRGPKIGLRPADPLSADNYYSIMQSNIGTNPWVTREQYLTLMDHLVTGGRDPRLLLVRGLLFGDGRTMLLPSYEAWGVEPDSIGRGEFALEGLDSGGTLLSRRYFDTLDIDDLAGVRSSFALALRWDSAARTLRLRRGATLLAERRVSVHRPELRLDPVEDLGNGRFRLRWHASDADGDSLWHLVAFSHDSTVRSLIVADSRDSALEFTTEDLPGGDACSLQVITTDGINTVEAISSPFVVEEKPPVAAILDPLNGARLEPGRPAILSGFGYDPEWGNLHDSSLVWYSDRDGLLGYGDRIVPLLSLATHRITLEVTDATGRRGTDTIVVNVTSSAPIDQNRLDELNLSLLHIGR